MKTREEVDALKVNWLSDPIWNIYETVGFEENQQELKEFQGKAERQWKENSEKQIHQRARKLNCSVELVGYIELLEGKLERMQDTIIGLANYLS